MPRATTSRPPAYGQSSRARSKRSRRSNYVVDLSDLTPGQQRILDAVRSRLYAIIVAWGPIRQAKTAGAVAAMSLLAWMDDRAGIGNGIYILGGVTVGAVHRNQDRYWYDVADQFGWGCRMVRGDQHYIALSERGREFCAFHVFGGDNQGSAGRMRGITATSAYCDESTLCVESFLDELEYRCSYDESVVLHTTNASDPYNAVKTKYLDTPNPLHHEIFVPWGDNHHYPYRRMEALDREHFGANYQRMILGQWVPETGIIFPIGPEMMTDLRPPMLTGVVAVDVGATGVTAALLFVRVGHDQWLVADEYIHDGARHGLVRPETFISTIRERWGIAEIVVPPDAPDFAARCRQQGLRVVAPDNDVLEGIKATQANLVSGRTRVWSGCIYLLREAAAYHWTEPSAQATTGPKPVKVRDHACDALRYGNVHLMPARGTFIYYQ